MAKMLFIGLILICSQVNQLQGQTLNPEDNMTIEKKPIIKDKPETAVAETELKGFDTTVERLVTKVAERKEQDTEILPTEIPKVIDVQNSTEKAEGHAKVEIKVTAMPADDVTNAEAASPSFIREAHRPSSDLNQAVVENTTGNPKEFDHVTGEANQPNVNHKKNKGNQQIIDPFVMPDPIDAYSNSIMLEGHVFGYNNDVLGMIHTALSSGEIFVPVEPLNIHPVTSSFEEASYEGDKFTSIRFVVSYNGRPIHTEIITRLMTLPKVSNHFNTQLEGRDLKQYSYKKAQPVENKSWIQQHLTVVIIPSCVAFVLIIIVTIAIVARKRSTGAPKQEKKKPLTPSSITEKKCPPPPYSMENPAYDFETSAVMDGYTLP